MVHLVYCDNTGKKGERVLDKILNGTKTMVVRGAAGRKIPHSRVFADETLYFMEKGESQDHGFCEGEGREKLRQTFGRRDHSCAGRKSAKTQLI